MSKSKKEFMKFSLRFLDKEKFLTLFKVRFYNCIGSNLRNKFLCKAFKSIDDIVKDKNSLESKEFLRFIIKNIKIIYIFLPYIQAHSAMLNLNFAFKSLSGLSSYYLSPYPPIYLTLNFQLVDSGKILSPVEFASIFFGYFNSFDLYTNF